MADRIKGIVVEIGGDTQGLDKALKGVNDTSRDLQKELRDVQRLLKFDPNNAELLAQRQKLLNDQIENTEKKLQALKDAQQQVQEQFERGDIGAEQYRAFQRELADTESYLRNTRNAVSDLQSEQESIASSTREMNRLFEVTGTTLEEFADTIGARTVRAIQQGTASSRDLQRAFDQIAQASLGASADVNEVRQSLQRLESGEQSIQGVRRELQQLSQDAQDSREEVKNLGGELGGLVAGAGAGMGLDAIFQKAMDISDLDTTIEISMEIPEESQQAVKDAITTVGSYIGDTETALEGVRKQFKLNAGLTDEENTRIVKGAGAIVKAYSEVDFSELIQETHEMALGMSMTHDDALGMTKALLDMGFPPDQLDIITEYGQQLHRAGYDASEIQAIFQAGIETGTWNIDVLMDGLKEGRILLSEFGAGVDETTQKMIQGTGISATQLQEWGKAVAQGGDAGKKAMTDVATAVMGIEDATKRNEVGVKLFGTLWEENGEMIGETLVGASQKTIDLATQQQKLNENVATLDALPQQELNTALSTLWTTLTPLLTSVASFVTKIAEWIQQNPTLSATILTIVAVIGILMGIFMAIAPIVTAVVGLMGTFSLTLGAIATPVLIVIGVIAGLIAIGVLLYKNWDTIMAWGKKLGKSIAESFKGMMESAKKWLGNLKDDVVRIWNSVMDFFEGIDLKQIGKDIIQGLINGISSMAEKVKETARNIANGIGEKIKSILKLGSPSKLMEQYGEFTGEGLAIGIQNSLGLIKEMASKMGKNAIPDMEMNVSKTTPVQTTSGKQLTVNIHSPKALDVRDASREFNRTLNKMSLMW